MRKAYSYIRMSTDTQARHGDSHRRQRSGSENYAKEHGLELVDSIDGVLLEDLGVSAFTGKNKQEGGAFALFIDALKGGKIEANSVLLVESLDRISREKLTEALPQFMDIVNRGVEIVTLLDGQSYTKERLDREPFSLFMSLSVMIRANEESASKARRVQAAWESKRKKASATAPITTVAPAWLTYSEKSNRFEIVEERAAIVSKIFQMCAETCGQHGIARYLNENNVAPFGKGKLWYRSYINKILTNRAVLGEFQPCSEVAGSARKPVGEPIKNYYPAVVDEKIFQLAAAAVSRRTPAGSGRKGKTFSNLFSRLLFCGCGYSVSLKNRGKPPKGGQYLCCSNKHAGGGCQMKEWRLDFFESAFFRHIREVDFNALLGRDEQEETAVVREIEANEQQEVSIKKERDRAEKMILRDDLAPEAIDRFVAKINAFELELKRLREMTVTAKRKLEELKSSKTMATGHQLKELVAALEGRRDDFFFRSSVHQAISKVVERIELINVPYVFQPWDLDEDSPEVRRYRGNNKDAAAMTFDELLELREFEAFCSNNFSKALKIKYKFGTRHVWVGDGVSALFQKTQPVS
jgi:DNA invertase Pin-like site-specific DNA recombinase